MTTQAAGTFDVKLTPQKPDDQVGDSGIGRMSLDKQFHDDLDATSKGTMPAAGTATKGSAGYVTIECMEGTLHGRTGTFVLQHNGTMTRGVGQLSVTVVPDSGTGGLGSRAGSMAIVSADGKHSYEFDYSLTPAA